jgi:hypothetical protein
MINNLEQILRLAQLTGDRLIVADQENPVSSLVILSLSDYEKLLDLAGLTKGQGFAKVSTNVASSDTGNISVKSSFVEQVDDRQKSHWSIPASRKSAAKDLAGEDK